MRVLSATFVGLLSLAAGVQSQDFLISAPVLTDVTMSMTLPNNTIAQNLALIPEISTLYGLLSSPTFSNLTGALGQPGNLTVLAPTNTAFTVFKYVGANPTDLNNLTGSLPAQAIPYLSNALQYHVIPSRAMSTALRSNYSNFFPTLLTNSYYVKWGPGNAQRVILRKQEDGSVIIPFDASYNSIHYANVVVADIMCSNGVIHLIDQILQIPDNIFNTAVRVDQYNFLSAVQVAGLLPTLESATNQTVLVPVNEALSPTFQQLMAMNLNASALTAALSPVLLQHVIPSNVVHSHEIELWSGRQNVTTAGGQSLRVTWDGRSGYTIGGASILEIDIPIANGVLHIINQTVQAM